MLVSREAVAPFVEVLFRIIAVEVARPQEVEIAAAACKLRQALSPEAVSIIKLVSYYNPSPTNK